MSGTKKRFSTNGGEGLTQNPFGALEGLGELPPGPENPPKVASAVAPQQASKRGKRNLKRGRVDIIRQTAHRGGKAVTVVTGFPGIGLPEKKELAKKMQKACSVGGTVKDGNIEIQGDQREAVRRILIEAGFQPVFAGG